MERRVIEKYQSQAGAASYNVKYEEEAIKRLSDQRERRLLEKIFGIVGSHDRFLDLPSGTGRLFRTIQPFGKRFVETDVSREMLKSNKKTAFTTLALFRHANPTAKLFTGKFFFLGGSTDLRKQPDGSLAGDLSGIAAKELAEVLRVYTFPPFDMALLTDW